MPNGEPSRHIDVRVPSAVHQKFYAVYHRWAPEKDDDSMAAFMGFLLEHGERALLTVGYRSFRP